MKSEDTKLQLRFEQRIDDLLIDLADINDEESCHYKFISDLIEVNKAHYYRYFGKVYNSSEIK